MIPGAISISAKTIGQQATVTITIADITEFLRRVTLDDADEPDAEPDAPDPEPADVHDTEPEPDTEQSDPEPDTDRSPLSLTLLRSIAPYSIMTV